MCFTIGRRSCFTEWKLIAQIDASNCVAETVCVAGISRVGFVPVVLKRALVEIATKVLKREAIA